MWWLLPMMLLMVLGAAAADQLPLQPQQLVAMAMAHLGRMSSRARSGDEVFNMFGQSTLTFTPKLEITSPTFPPDGGTLQIYTTIPLTMGDLHRTFMSSEVQQRDHWTDDADQQLDHFPDADGYHGYRPGRSDDVTASPGDGFHDYAEMFLQRLGMDGHSCLLRAVCELSAHPLRNNGLLGDIINIAAEVPSSTNHKKQEELKIARQLGLNKAPCAEVFSTCKNMVIDSLALKSS